LIRLKLTALVKYAVLNYTTCVPLPVKQLVSNQKEFNYPLLLKGIKYLKGLSGSISGKAFSCALIFEEMI